jgi:hypothetical protein
VDRVAPDPPERSDLNPPAPPDDVFGTVLPDQTRDDRDGGDWREEVERDRDDELREDVPPHH